MALLQLWPGKASQAGNRQHFHGVDVSGGQRHVEERFTQSCSAGDEPDHRKLFVILDDHVFLFQSDRLGA